MGHRKQHAPRHGSLSYRPRKRAFRSTGRIRTWPSQSGDPKIIGFAGYKVGMTHVIVTDNRMTSPWYGREISRAVTIVDTPPMLVAAIRGFRLVDHALQVAGECWAEKLPKDFDRLLQWPDKYDAKAALEKFTKMQDKLVEIRVILMTQPRQAGVSRKKPELIECAVAGGTIPERIEHAKKHLGKEIRVRDFFQPGQYVDVTAITKGKGWQGVVKRFGVSILPHKSRKRIRAVGTLGPWTPGRIMYTCPRGGQMGYHQRTEYNKYIMKIGEKSDDITPSGGFTHYGVLSSDFLLVDGSIPGPAKRLVRLRAPIRPSAIPDKAPDILYISTKPKK